ncbi:MAG: ABC transporter ATP-binding protein [Thermodesulfobacteriota bacterium]
MSQPPVIIDVQGLVKRFGPNTVVNGVSLTVRQGEVFGFLGPNGAGKTTTIRMLCGLLTPDGGSGACLGFDVIRGSRQIKPLVGYMAQRFSLYEDLTVQENLNFIASMYGVPQRRQAVQDTIARLELGPYRQHLARTLSGGWKQRLALASCLIHQPKLLLLDEPTAGVDPKARREFWDRVHQLTAEGITALISTHYMDEAERCHRLAYIAAGRLLAEGTVEEVVERQGLTTWAVTGGELHELSGRLKGLPGVEQVVAFGNSLHVSGRDAAALERSIAPLRSEPYKWRQAATSLEEVFISLMSTPGGRA